MKEFGGAGRGEYDRKRGRRKCEGGREGDVMFFIAWPLSKTVYFTMQHWSDAHRTSAGLSCKDPQQYTHKLSIRFPLFNNTHHTPPPLIIYMIPFLRSRAESSDPIPYQCIHHSQQHLHNHYHFRPWQTISPSDNHNEQHSLGEHGVGPLKI